MIKITRRSVADATFLNIVSRNVLQMHQNAKSLDYSITNNNKIYSSSNMTFLFIWKDKPSLIF